MFTLYGDFTSSGKDEVTSASSTSHIRNGYRSNIITCTYSYIMTSPYTRIHLLSPIRPDSQLKLLPYGETPYMTIKVRRYGTLSILNQVLVGCMIIFLVRKEIQATRLLERNTLKEKVKSIHETAVRKMLTYKREAGKGGIS